MTTLTPPLKWHGGKHYLADWIIGHMPEHTAYVEPFAGGLSVLLRKPTGASEVVNDLDLALTNFWRVLQDHAAGFEELVRIAEATPFSEDAFRAADAFLADWEPEDGEEASVQAAWAFFVQVRQSRQGLRKDFATLSKSRTRRGMNEQASSWLGAIEGLRDVHDRLKGVVVVSRPAKTLIRQQDHRDTLFYLDPPYLHQTRAKGARNAYAIEMTDEDHGDLLETIAHIKGRFLLSGYPSELYTAFAKNYGWHCVSKPIANHSSGASSKEIKDECLWMNYDPPAPAASDTPN